MATTLTPLSGGVNSEMAVAVPQSDFRPLLEWPPQTLRQREGTLPTEGERRLKRFDWEDALHFGAEDTVPWDEEAWRAASEARWRPFWQEYEKEVVPRLGEAAARAYDACNLHDGDVLSIRLFDEIGLRFASRRLYRFVDHPPQVEIRVLNGCYGEEGFYTLRYRGVHRFEVILPEPEHDPEEMHSLYGGLDTWHYSRLRPGEGNLVRHEIILARARLVIEFKELRCQVRRGEPWHSEIRGRAQEARAWRKRPEAEYRRRRASGAWLRSGKTRAHLSRKPTLREVLDRILESRED